MAMMVSPASVPPTSLSFGGPLQGVDRATLVNLLVIENILLVMANRVFLLLSALLSVAFLGRVEAECANACNGHGKCTSYDMCICHRNWQANDCSERVCMHGLAHVDTPKVSTQL